MNNQLINCPACNGKVAKDAPSCPHCGKTIAGQKTEQTTGKDALLMVGSFIVGLILALILSALPGEDGNPGLRVLLGILGIATPPTAVFIYSSRPK